MPLSAVSKTWWEWLFRTVSSSSFIGKHSVFGVFLEASAPSVLLLQQNCSFRFGLWTVERTQKDQVSPWLGRVRFSPSLPQLKNLKGKRIQSVLKGLVCTCISPPIKINLRFSRQWDVWEQFHGRFCVLFFNFLYHHVFFFFFSYLFWPWTLSSPFTLQMLSVPLLCLYFSVLICSQPAHGGFAAGEKTRNNSRNWVLCLLCNCCCLSATRFS